MEDDLLDKILERSVAQYRTALFEARDGIRRDIHKASNIAQEENREAIRWHSYPCVTMKAVITTNHTTMNSSHPVETSVATITSAPVLIKKKELAKRLSVSTRTIDDWTRKRKIPYLQLGNRFFLYDAAAVLDTLRKQYQIDSVKWVRLDTKWL